MREVTFAVSSGPSFHARYSACYDLFPIELVGLVTSVTYAYDDYRTVDDRLRRVLGVDAQLYASASRGHEGSVTLIGTYFNRTRPGRQGDGRTLRGLSPLVASIEVWLSVPVPGIAQLLVVVSPNELGRHLGRDVLLAHDYDVVVPRWNGAIHTESIREQKQLRLARSLQAMASLPMFPSGIGIGGNVGYPNGVLATWAVRDLPPDTPSAPTEWNDLATILGIDSPSGWRGDEGILFTSLPSADNEGDADYGFTWVVAGAGKRPPVLLDSPALASVMRTTRSIRREYYFWLLIRNALTGIEEQLTELRLRIEEVDRSRLFRLWRLRGLVQTIARVRHQLILLKGVFADHFDSGRFPPLSAARAMRSVSARTSERLLSEAVQERLSKLLQDGWDMAITLHDRARQILDMEAAWSLRVWTAWVGVWTLVVAIATIVLLWFAITDHFKPPSNGVRPTPVVSVTTPTNTPTAQ
jgi:hypothetical protein